MKSLTLIVLSITITLFSMSCNNQPNTVNQDKHAESESEMSESSIITLNNGEKWPVNEEMKPFILEAETILNDYITNKSADYQTLAAQLLEKNSGLIRNCTMQGQAHDELHNWLFPHMELIEALGGTQNVEDAQALISQMKKSFETYHQYFQ